jgi:hypothetical protein
MRFEFEVLDSRVRIKITYSRKIWDTLEKIYQANRLVRHRVTRPWGEENTENSDFEAYVYRENSRNPFANVIDKIHRSYSNINVVDDINRPLIDIRNTINIAFLRIVPNCNNDTCEVITDAPIDVYNLNTLKLIPKILIEVIKELREIEKPKIARIVVEFRDPQRR